MNMDTAKQLEELLKDLYISLKRDLGLDQDVSQIVFKMDRDSEDDPLLGKTAYYNPGDKSITLFTNGRHPKDILRSFSHEMTHFAQDCSGEFTDEVMGDTSPGYAQRNSGLKRLEADAYLRGNMNFRKWEDNLKYGEPEVSTLYENLTPKGKPGLLSEKLEYSEADKQARDEFFEEGIKWMDEMHDNLALTSEDKERLHDTFAETIGEKLEEIGFLPSTYEKGYAMDYEFEDIELTIFPYGKYGLEDDNYEDEIDNDKKILLRIEMNNKEEGEQDIVHKKYDSYAELYKNLLHLASGLNGD
jgi:hypothetical protein